jgi:hypothetical protein
MADLDLDIDFDVDEETAAAGRKPDEETAAAGRKPDIFSMEATSAAFTQNLGPRYAHRKPPASRDASDIAAAGGQDHAAAKKARGGSAVKNAGDPRGEAMVGQPATPKKRKAASDQLVSDAHGAGAGALKKGGSGVANELSEGTAEASKEVTAPPPEPVPAPATAPAEQKAKASVLAAAPSGIQWCCYLGDKITGRPMSTRCRLPLPKKYATIEELLKKCSYEKFRNKLQKAALWEAYQAKHPIYDEHAGGATEFTVQYVNPNKQIGLELLTAGTYAGILDNLKEFPQAFVVEFTIKLYKPATSGSLARGPGRPCSKILGVLIRRGVSQQDVAAGDTRFLCDETGYDIVTVPWPAVRTIDALLRVGYDAAVEAGIDLADCSTDGELPQGFAWTGAENLSCHPVTKYSHVQPMRMTQNLRSEDFELAIRLAFAAGDVPAQQPSLPRYAEWRLTDALYDYVHVIVPSGKVSKGAKATRAAQYKEATIWAAVRVKCEEWRASNEPIGDTPRWPIFSQANLSLMVKLIMADDGSMHHPSCVPVGEVCVPPIWANYIGQVAAPTEGHKPSPMSGKSARGHKLCDDGGGYDYGREAARSEREERREDERREQRREDDRRHEQMMAMVAAASSGSASAALAPAPAVAPSVAPGAVASGAVARRELLNAYLAQKNQIGEMLDKKRLDSEEAEELLQDAKAVYDAELAAIPLYDRTTPLAAIEGSSFT